MLRSLQEERSRHFRLALRIGIPVLIFVMALVYGVFYREEPIAMSPQNVAIFLAMLFAIVYFIFFALELSRKETLLDRVTGGYHYESFLERLRRHRPTTLAAIQVSNLSVINEAYGVRKADALLRKVVETLDRELFDSRKGIGWIGRANGAEFLLALEEDPESVEQALERFAKAHQDFDGVEVEFVTAVIRNNIDDPEKALEQLRELLVQRARCGISPAEAPVSDARRLSQEEQAVVDALEREDLFLAFRPMKNLQSGRVDLYEISVKMRATDGTTIAPRDFLPIVNRRNLGERYDLLIVRRVLAVARSTDSSISLSFNLSPFSLRRATFLEAFRRELQASGVTPRRLIVELYERKSHHRLEEYLRRLKVLKEWGVRLCLDNFGSSNASMEYLRHFPFDMIEFDRDFTFELGQGKSLSMLRSFVSMAKETGMITAAKWVDDDRKIQILQAIGVDYIQGFAAGKLLDEVEFVRRHKSAKKESL